MASDRDMAFLLDRARLAGAKVVLVGDDRQLGAIGPGGAMGALVERHGGAVHSLHQNVRQLDERERGALIELRAGDVEKAVEFYLSSGRVVIEPSRSGALARADRTLGPRRGPGEGRGHVRLAPGQRGRVEPPGPRAHGRPGTGDRPRARGPRRRSLRGRRSDRDAGPRGAWRGRHFRARRGAGRRPRAPAPDRPDGRRPAPGLRA